MNHKITTHLWFDRQAKDAAKFYAEVFDHCTIKSMQTLSSTPSGDVDIISLDVEDQPFVFISAGPDFTMNPSISFLIACATSEEVDKIYNKIREGSTPLMDMGEYAFSKRYTWLIDKFGVSWQIMNMGERPINQKITPTLMFVGDVCGRAEEAVNFYTSLFPDSKIHHVMRYESNEAPDKEGTIKHTGFILNKQWFGAMDSAHNHQFKFNEAISFIVNCDTQEEIDYYWEKLSAVPEAEQCGWLKDKFGVSWQIVPSKMQEYLSKGTPEQISKTTQAFLKMKKLIIADLEAIANS